MFSSYNFPAKSTVPQPPIPNANLGPVNTPIGNVSTATISGRNEGEYIVSPMDAKQGVAQYTPIVHSVPCLVLNDAPKANIGNKQFYPKGTLVLVGPVPDQKSKGFQRTSRFPRSQTSEPVPSCRVSFNTPLSQRTQGTSYVPTILFPLAEATEVYTGKAQFIALAVQDVTEVAVNRENPSFSFRPGDDVYARRIGDDTYIITEDGGDFYLGKSMVYQSHDVLNVSQRAPQNIQVALRIRAQ
jgi:hypothetical protein